MRPMKAMKERREELVQRLDGFFDFGVILGLSDHHSGQERADDGCQADLAGDGREPETQQYRG